MGDADYSKGDPVDVEAILEALESGEAEQIVAIAREAHPGDVEIAFERLDDEDREQVLDQLPAEVLSAWADYLPASAVEHRLNTLPETERREVLESLSDDELVDFLQEVDEEDRSQYIELLDEETRQISEDLLKYPEESAGGRMTKAMAVVPEHFCVRQALDVLEAIREEAELLSRIYVVDDQQRILGKLRLRDLAFSRWNTPIRDLMDGDQMSVNAMADQEEAAQMIARYDLMALPVVDDEGRLLGVITHDDALEILEEESTEDIERISGIGGQSDFAYLQTPPLAHFRRRFGWILTMAFLGLGSGIVLHSFEDILTKFFILALYFPMVVAAGGNTGAQAATMVVRAMSLGEVGTREFWRVIWTEGRVGILIGALLGICVGLQIRFLMPAGVISSSLDPVSVALVVGIALMLQVLTSTLIGAALPIGAKKMKLDPAVVASPAITTAVDVTGCFIYFSLAHLFLG